MCTEKKMGEYDPDHNHTLQTNLQHCEEEPLNISGNKT